LIKTAVIFTSILAGFNFFDIRIALKKEGCQQLFVAAAFLYGINLIS